MERKARLVTLRRSFIGIAVSLVFIALFFYQLDSREMLSTLAQGNYLLTIPGAFLCLLFMVLRAWRWQFLLRPLSLVSFRSLFPILMAGYAINNLIPLRVGEIARAYYLGNREKLSKTACFATVVVERVFDGLGLLFLIALVVLFAPIPDLLARWEESSGISGLWLVLGLVLPFPLTLAMLLLLLFRFSTFNRLLLFLRFPAQIRELVALFVEGLGVLRGFRSLLILFGFSLLIWLVEVLVFWVMIYAFNLEEQLSSSWSLLPALILTMSLSNLATALPSSSGGIGPFEFFAQTTLILLGVSSGVASAYAVAVHAVLIIPISILGLGFLWWLHLPLRPLLQVNSTGNKKANQPRGRS